MKKCRKCEKDKELIQFHKWAEGKDGLCHYCKECIRKDRKEYLERNHERLLKIRKEQREKNPESRKISAKKSYEKHKASRIEKAHKYVENNRKLINEKQRIYYRKNRIKINAKENAYLATEKGKEQSRAYYYKTQEMFKIKRNARNKLRYAVRTGKIVKAELCEKCLEKRKLHGHHEDYNSPLIVIWVCSPCHSKIHKEGN